MRVDNLQAGPDAERCLWTVAAPGITVPEVPLPQRTDVAIVGGGYTGLAAARALHPPGPRGGRPRRRAPCG
jgi:NADPH-dependent 2,4-dienoyl-CoA reductase/sulfur reductase-like enzyme